jgi:hypothetical protein
MDSMLEMCRGGDPPWLVQVLSGVGSFLVIVCKTVYPHMIRLVQSFVGVLERRKDVSMLMT